MDRLKSAFYTLDTNNDGTLSLDELKNGLKNLCFFELMQDHSKECEDCHKQVMERCDLDGDGKIDYIEFIQASIDHKSILN